MQADKKGKLRLWVYICVVVGIIVLGVLILFRIYRPQENIFFLQYENEYGKDDTIIYKYNSKSKTVVEIGRVQGRLQDCVINSDETYITGLIFGEGFEIVRYDLVAGTVESLDDAARKIDTLVGKSGGSSPLIYSEGNKIFISLEGKNGDRKWLLYDLTTDQYDIVEAEDGVIQYLTIYDDKLRYIGKGRVLYKYDLEKKEKTQIMESVHSDAVVMPKTGLVAYTKDIHRKEIYLYDIGTQENRCITTGGWNICYGDLSWTNSGWSDTGREFFYIEYFPGLFNEATNKLMIYDVITQSSRCIYKEKMTVDEFRYVIKR